jgi:hypothetical protein
MGGHGNPPSASDARVDVPVVRTAWLNRLRTEWLEVTANPHSIAFYEQEGLVVEGALDARLGPAPRMHPVVAR